MSLKSASVLVFNGDRILLLRRSITDSWMPLAWDTPGGGIDRGETPRKAALRETWEEAGIKLRKIQPFWIRKTLGHTAHIFYSETNQRQVRTSHEHDDFMWIRPEDINFDLINVVNRVQECIELYLEEKYPSSSKIRYSI